ncbi:membrane protein [Algoriphagus jejuensis]|uniref:Membrane protein n=1 Tax=Algoriphagus jejuensis TaxID=419934 RepID=A0ABN1N4N4_9BACT
MKLPILKTVLRITLGAFMVYAGILHLTSKRMEFQALVPRWLPDDPSFLDFVVISSGVVEIGLGLAMIFWTSQKTKTGIALAVFLILVFFGNLSQYTNGIDAFGLDTDQKRLIRLFFQPILIVWALWSTDAFNLGKKPQP